MLRYTVVLILITLSTMLLSSHPTSAFTLRFGPVAAESPTLPGSEPEPSDVPTPQLIRVAIDPSGVTVGTISPTDGYRTSEPALQLQTQNLAPLPETVAPQQQASQQAEHARAAYQLSGPELLLLRKTSVVAEHQGDVQR